MKKQVVRKKAKKPAIKKISKPVAKKATPKKLIAKKYQVSFGEAVDLMKAGNKCAREGWNGKGMFVIFVQGQKKVPLSPESAYAKVFPKRKAIDINGHFDMYTAQRQMQPGWLASQTDIAATDWMVIK